MDQLIVNRLHEILEIASRHGAGNVRVFGSRARNDARPDSDADFLVDLVGQPSPWFPGGLIADLEQLLQVSVDVGSDSELHPAIREAVLREAVPL